jgi:hypothetical protein
VGLRRPLRRTDNLTTYICRLYLNPGATTFSNPQGISRPVQGIALFLWYCYSILDRTFVFTFIFVKVLFIGLSGSALCDREVTVRALHFVSHGERQGTFVSVQQFCNLSNWNSVSEPRNVGFSHKLFTVNLLFPAMPSLIAYSHTRLSSGSNWILQSVLAAISSSLFKPAVLNFKLKAIYFRITSVNPLSANHWSSCRSYYQ